MMNTCTYSIPEQELSQPAEIVPGRLYFALASVPEGTLPKGLPKGSFAYWLDQDLIYEPFCADFGPCNLAHTWRFCERTNHLLEEGARRQGPIFLLVGPHPHKRANAAALVGIYSILFLNKTSEQAYAPLRSLEPFVGFRDATCGVPTYTLGVYDIICGMARARDVGFINWHKGEVLDVEEYEHYEQVENGDLNWIVPNKLMAFSGPSATPKHFGGWRTFTPEDYVGYFKEKGVKAVVRLNKKMYEASRFTENGIKHHDLYFPDGTCPSEPILFHFLDIVEKEPGAIAVHCKAGLGRTGVLICAYMIKHYNFSAEEAMAYIRVCRPGSVLGPQQHYLLQYGPRLLHEGNLMRQSLLKARNSSSLEESSSSASNTISSSDASSPKKKVINLTATSRTIDIITQNAPPAPHSQALRRSARLSSSRQDQSGRIQNVGSEGAHKEKDTQITEPDHIVSIPKINGPPASPSKPDYAKGIPVHIYVEAEHSKEAKDNVGTSTPLKKSYPRIPSMASTPSGLTSKQESQNLSAVSTPATMKMTPMPPSSTKRVLAPNGQPRKIPLAVDFDDVDGMALEDLDMHDSKTNDGFNDEDDWKVSSKPVQDKNYNSNRKVGAFAAAAGRGASAFVEAFRLAVGNHRKNYGRQT